MDEGFRLASFSCVAVSDMCDASLPDRAVICGRGRKQWFCILPPPSLGALYPVCFLPRFRPLAGGQHQGVKKHAKIVICHILVFWSF